MLSIKLTFLDVDILSFSFLCWLYMLFPECNEGRGGEGKAESQFKNLFHKRCRITRATYRINFMCEIDSCTGSYKALSAFILSML